jgi:hypothetical protein
MITRDFYGRGYDGIGLFDKSELILIYYDYINKPIKDFHDRIRNSNHNIRSFAISHFEGDCL